MWLVSEIRLPNNNRRATPIAHVWATCSRGTEVFRFLIHRGHMRPVKAAAGGLNLELYGLNAVLYYGIMASLVAIIRTINNLVKHRSNTERDKY